ncbi:hypothetical protein NA76_20565 [Vibrio vulnificus]|nr:hypothetical protein NA76_20565 [Vibrio vulnificus]
MLLDDKPIFYTSNAIELYYTRLLFDVLRLTMMNAVESIVEWSKDKPVWWNLALKVALEEGELNQKHIDFIFNFAKSVEGLEPKHPNYEQILSPIDISGYTDEENSERNRN